MDLAQAIRDATPGQTIQVPAGRYPVNLELTKDVTLIARGQVVLDGSHAGAVIRVTGASVRLSGFTIVGGRAPEAGGGVSVVDGELELSDCTLRFNQAPLYGGGALNVRDAKAVATRCRFEANTGRQGGGILVDGVASLKLSHCTVIQNAAVEGGGLRVKEGATAELFACTIADNKVVGEAAAGGALSLTGSTTRAPTVRLSHCIVAERSEGPVCLFNHPRLPGSLRISRSLLPPWCTGFGPDNKVGPPGFVMEGNEPYLLAPESLAVGAGDPAAFDLKDADVGGAVRIRKGVVDLGAFAFSGGRSSSLPY